jgi:ATP-dependent Clp endopeptidase proteolytic subunit ClpP
VNPFLRQPSAYQRTPLRAERPNAKTTERGVVTLRLYDPLDSWGDDWGVSAKEFVSVLDDLPDDTEQIRLLINSPGGECWEGLAVLNALRAHPAKVTAVVEGIAASSASFIAAGVDELEVMENAEIFVHCAWGGCIGNAADMAKMAADLSHEDRNLASIYAGKAGGAVDEWLARMCGETFFSAEEAVEVGLADRVVKAARGKADAVAKAKARFDLSVFARRDNAPRATFSASGEEAGPVAVSQPAPAADPTPQFLPPTDPPPNPGDDPAPPVDTTAPDEGPQSPAAEPDQPTEENAMSLDKGVRERLGLAEDADEAAVLAALDARLQPDEPEPDPEPLPDPAPLPADEPVPAGVSASAAPPAAVDPALAQEVALLKEQMTAMSAQLAAANAEKAAAVKASVLDEAQRAGKFKPADRASWEANYDKAPDVCASVLASIAPGTAVPVMASGVTGPAEPTEDESRFDALFTRKVVA